MFEILSAFAAPLVSGLFGGNKRSQPTVAGPPGNTDPTRPGSISSPPVGGLFSGLDLGKPIESFSQTLGSVMKERTRLSLLDKLGVPEKRAAMERRYQQGLYPGTQPWERLGVASTNVPSEVSRRQREDVRAQLVNQLKVAQIQAASSVLSGQGVRLGNKDLRELMRRLTDDPGQVSGPPGRATWALGPLGQRLENLLDRLVTGIPGAWKRATVPDRPRGVTGEKARKKAPGSRSVTRKNRPSALQRLRSLKERRFGRPRPLPRSSVPRVRLPRAPVLTVPRGKVYPGPNFGP